MSTNKYFNNLYHDNTQNLFEDLLQESIQIHGVDIIYIVRDVERFDELLREEKLSIFKTTYKLEAYVPDVGQNTTMQKFMSKFGFRFEENSEVIISSKTWDELGTGFVQPREGDYIYIGNPDENYASFVNCTFQINQIWDGIPDNKPFGSNAAYRLTLSSVNKNYSAVIDTNYTDINEFLNPTETSENKTTIKKKADEFTDVNVSISNPFTKFGSMK